MIKTTVLTLLTLAFIAGTSSLAFGAGSNSVYLQMSSDALVSNPTTLMSATINVTESGYVYVQSDGRFGPSGSPSLAIINIYIDSIAVSNGSVLEWTRSTNGQQHSFNVIGSAYLTPGNHTISLFARGDGSFYIGAGTNLSIMTNAAANVVNNTTTQNTGDLSFTTQGILDGTPIPHTTVLQNTVASSGEPIIALSSGRAYHGNSFGDALWGLYLDGIGEHNDSATWSDNDIFSGAEYQAPMFNQAFFSGVPPGNHVVSLEASEEPYTDPVAENGVDYHVGADTRLITLNGGMNVFGKAPVSTAVNNRTDYVCVGSNQGWPGCPPVGTDVVLDDTYVDIPQGHNGVVLFMTKTRVQGGDADGGGTTSIHLVIDGNGVGSAGVQQLAYPNSVSTRTLCASYLAAGNQALAPGRHHVQVIGRADGAFIHLAMTKDLPLMWFD